MKAHNKYIADYKPKDDSNYRMYGYANYLYGWAMSQNLPCKMLRSGQTATLQKILKTPDDSPKGNIVEVNLKFSQHFCTKKFH